MQLRWTIFGHRSSKRSNKRSCKEVGTTNGKGVMKIYNTKMSNYTKS